MGTLNHTTQISALKTAGEIQTILAKHGAEAVALRYADAEPVGISFGIQTPYGLRYFDLPVRHDGVYEVLKKQASRNIIRRAYANPEQAKRTAWRVLKVWLEAQLAIIEAQMVSLDEVMLPYLRGEDGHTLYQSWQESEKLSITTGSDR
jgi:hypothetical protein